MNFRKISFPILIMIEAAVLVAVILLAAISGATHAASRDNMAASDTQSSPMKSETQQSGTQKPEENTGTETIPEDYVEKEIAFSAEVEQKLASMTVEQQVAQLFIVTPEQLTGVTTVTIAGDGTRQALNRYPVGGFVYSEKNFRTEAQAKALLSNAQGFSQELTGLPLFLAIAEEGGETESPVAGALQYPKVSSLAELEKKGDITGVYEASSTRAGYLSNLGMNLLLAPRTDITADEGADVQTVAEGIREDIRASRDNGMMTVLKYFPSKNAESKEWDALSQTDFIYVKEGRVADCIMVSNGACEALTQDVANPCCMSPTVVAVLRQTLGYEGLLITDSLSDERIINNYSSKEAAVQCLTAGCDIIYCPLNFREAYEGVLEAVKNGNISSIRLHNAVGRVLSNKMK